ncbi:hypothetical protein GCM10027258_10200 [Amycolatopsis stemonae]
MCRVLAVLHGEERADQGSPEGGDDPETEIAEIVAEHQCEGGSDGEDKADDKPRPAQKAAARVVTHAGHA